MVAQRLCSAKQLARPDARGDHWPRTEKGWRYLFPLPNVLQTLTWAPNGPWAWQSHRWALPLQLAQRTLLESFVRSLQFTRNQSKKLTAFSGMLTWVDAGRNYVSHMDLRLKPLWVSFYNIYCKHTAVLKSPQSQNRKKVLHCNGIVVHIFHKRWRVQHQQQSSDWKPTYCNAYLFAPN